MSLLLTLLQLGRGHLSYPVRPHPDYMSALYVWGL